MIRGLFECYCYLLPVCIIIGAVGWSIVDYDGILFLGNTMNKKFKEFSCKGKNPMELQYDYILKMNMGGTCTLKA